MKFESFNNIIKEGEIKSIPYALRIICEDDLFEEIKEKFLNNEDITHYGLPKGLCVNSWLTAYIKVDPKYVTDDIINKAPVEITYDDPCEGYLGLDFAHLRNIQSCTTMSVEFAMKELNQLIDYINSLIVYDTKLCNCINTIINSYDGLMEKFHKRG